MCIILTAHCCTLLLTEYGSVKMFMTILIMRLVHILTLLFWVILNCFGKSSDFRTSIEKVEPILWFLIFKSAAVRPFLLTYFSSTANKKSFGLMSNSGISFPNCRVLVIAKEMCCDAFRWILLIYKDDESESISIRVRGNFSFWFHPFYLNCVQCFKSRDNKFSSKCTIFQTHVCQ